MAIISTCFFYKMLLNACFFFLVFIAKNIVFCLACLWLIVINWS